MPEITFPLDLQPTIASAPVQQMAPDARAALMKPSSSRSQRRIQEDMETRRRELEGSGALKPATIINFNPVPLVLDGLIRITVPAAGYSQAGRVDWDFDGRTYVGHLLTIHTPLLYSRTSGHETDPEVLSDVPTLEANHILPIGIAYAFWEHYAGNAKDSPHMGGVMIFEGDKHTLSERHLEESGRMLRVPEPILLPRNRRSFTTKPHAMDEVVEGCFSMQAMYADFVIQNAHSLYTTNDPMQQKQITEIDRLWARWAQDKGMIPNLPEWVHTRILSGAAAAAVVRCPNCSKPRQFNNILLCPECRAPYDAFEAYMGGAQVAQMHLDMLPDDKLAIVAAEMVRRENRTKNALAKAKADAKKNAAAQTDEDA